jgi:leader peptidase (prepilin peptidase) / N-methyltransferase
LRRDGVFPRFALPIPETPIPLLVRLAAMAIAAAAILVALRKPWRTGAAGSALSRRALAAHGVFLAALAAGLAFAQQDAAPADIVQGALLLGILYGVAVTDVATLEVPLAPLFLGMVVRVGSTALLDRAALPATVLGLFSGAGVLAVVGLAYEWVRGRPGLGHGDTAVLGLIGSYVGWQGLLPALLAGAAAGLLGGGGALLLTRRPLDTPVPFVPFLAAGGWAVYLAQAVGWLPRGAGWW